MTCRPAITFAHLRRQSVRALALAWAMALALAARDASALFIVNQPWVRPAAKSKTTQAYMNLTSTDGARLLEARSDDARRVTLELSRSAPGKGLALPARSEVALLPGHDHLTLSGLTRKLKIGDRVKIILVVQDDDGTVREIAANAEVRLRSPIDDERRARHHH